ncbi:aminotransferase class V-fold PLP-dependent enzyme [Bergeriella denitrificans]|uniref:Cysteine desulfurase n=1 Tax=Bergeriella denitrificans TaxID=494 RepID=A0A378UGU9_BERDE|nr:aminotransferase class V-fold PLP-dependent enzyme [Bergeriella denitrificans]STZ76360.1 cysteine desulfurase [Bergeriella denitrificans]
MFSLSLSAEIRSRFACVDEDPDYGTRLFFDNSGGSLRLKEAIRIKEAIDLLPDCPERQHRRALDFQELIAKGIQDVLGTVFGAGSGKLMVEQSASQAMFQVVAAIMENVGGGNAVTTNVEHPSAYDAVKFYCEKTQRAFRVAAADRDGFVTPQSVAALVDEQTVLVSVIASSNISGNIMDLPGIIRAIRAKNPNVYIITDAVQHMPHGTLDVEALGIDAANFAPYKFFGGRGVGFAYLSPRLARLPHHRLLDKPEDTWILGTPTPSVFASFSAVIDYVCWLGKTCGGQGSRRDLYLSGMHAIEEQERFLLHRLLEGGGEMPGLRHQPKVRVYADTPDLSRRDLIVAMGIEGWDFEALRLAYERAGVVVYERVNSSIYSRRIVEALGLSGALRVSPLHCHTAEDIDRFLAVTAELADAAPPHVLAK